MIYRLISTAGQYGSEWRCGKRLGMDFSIRDATDADVGPMTEIYNALLETTTIEWTEELHTVEERLAWQHAQAEADLPVLVAVDADDRVIGWTTYGPFRDNAKWPGYRFTAEHSVHVDGAASGRGVGRALVEELLVRAEAAGIRVMIAAIDGANIGSVRFHERLGFVTVGELREVGFKHDTWLDLVLMQRTLAEREIDR